MEKTLAGLYLSSQTRNYVPGFSFYLKELNSLLELKIQLTLDQRLELIQFLYNLLSLEHQIEPFLIEGISNCLSRLLKKSKLKDAMLILDWKIPYSQLEKVYLAKSSDNPLPGTVKHISSLQKLTSIAKEYFDSQDIMEILKEFLPRINLYNLSESGTRLSLLALFLPTKEDSIKWVGVFFQIWKLVVQDATVDQLMLEIFSNLAFDQVHSIPQEVGISRELVSFLVSKGQAAMGLPTGSSNAKINWHQSLKQEITIWVGSRIQNLAKFLIWTWFPNDKYKLGTVFHLETLLQAIEGYYHPSNYGKWSSGLAKFLQSLSSQYLKRIRLEKAKDCKTPTENRLTEEDHEKFVLFLRPLTLMSMFSKDSSSIVATHTTLKNLAWISPDLILPPLLERIYPSLESLTESHRTLSCIGALCSVSRPLFTYSHFPKGAAHLIPVLSLVLPGIDMNDPAKSSATLLFIILLLHTVPLVECSDTDVNLSMEEEVFVLNTIGLQDWVLHFLSRIITLFENLPEGHESSSNNRQTSETSLIEMVMWSCEMIFCQTSFSIQEACMMKILNFVSKNVIPSATKAISFLCGSVHGANPARRLAAFVPLCKKQILMELESGASTIVGGSNLASNQNPFGFARMSDAPFHYFQSILISCVYTSGEDLMIYSEDFLEILDKTYQKCVSRRGYKWAAKLLRTLCFSLGSTYVKETRSHPSHVWNLPEFQTQPFRYYGRNYLPDELSVDWHVPNNAEVECAIRFLEIFTERTLDQISKVNDPLAPGFGNDLCRWLCWVKSIIFSLNALLEPEISVFESSKDDIYQEPHERCPIQSIYAVNKDHPQYLKLRSLRERVGAELARISKLLLVGYGEDSIEPVRALIKNIFLFMTYRGADYGRFDGFSRLLSFLKTIIKSEEDHKNLPRTYAVKRMYLLHLARLKYNSSKSMYEPVYQVLVDAIFQFTVSKYSQIRRSSLPTLGRILRCYPAYKYDLFPKYLAILSVATSEEKDDDVIDGACQVLRSSSFLGMTLRNWSFAQALLLTLVKAEKNIQRPKSLEILRKLFFEFILQFSGIPFDYPLCHPFNYGIALNKLTLDDNERIRMENVSLKRSQLAMSSYSSLLKDMVQLMRDSNLHWRFCGMALNFLGLILCEKQSVPAELTTFVAETIVNEHPALRKSSIALAIKILVVQKKRATMLETNKIENLKRTISLDSDSAKKFKISFMNWFKKDDIFAEIPYYVDYGCNIGWTCFPSTFRGYAVEGGDFLYSDETSADSEEILKTLVKSREFWRLFLGFMSQESGSEFNEAFNNTAFLFYKRIFSRYGPDPLEVAYEYVNLNVLAIQDKSKQRAATEFIAGVIRGSKHWSISTREKMWIRVIPLIKAGIQSATAESATYWGELVTGKQDPRRVKPLIDLILSNQFEPNSESFFSESKKLAFVNEIFLTFSWRIHQIMIEYLEFYHQNLSNPYKSIRDTLGKLMCNLINAEAHPTPATVEEIINAPTHLIPYQNAEIRKMINNVVSELEKCRVNNNLVQYQNISKSVLAYAIECLQSSQIFGSTCLLICMREIFLMQDSSDIDLQTLAKHVFQVLFPIFPHSPHQISEIIQMYLEFLNDPNDRKGALAWHRRKRILPALQIVYYQNLHILTRESQEKVLNQVNELLFDSQLEIRQLAAATLSGLVRCSRRDVILKILESSVSFLISLKIPKKFKDVTNGVVLKCHGSVLALGALILAFPYEIMDWMPTTLIVLSRFVSYVSPIGPEVKKIFAEFRRTHQDNWQEDKTKFSEDQLYELSDLLISPSYYV